MEKGSLGLRSFVDMNRTLQEKWLWRYLMEKKRLWSQINEARWDGELGRGFVSEVVRSHGMGLWRKIGSGRHQFLECIQ